MCLHAFMCIRDKKMSAQSLTYNFIQLLHRLIRGYPKLPERLLRYDNNKKECIMTCYDGIYVARQTLFLSYDLTTGRVVGMFEKQRS